MWSIRHNGDISVGKRTNIYNSSDVILPVHYLHNNKTDQHRKCPNSGLVCDILSSRIPDRPTGSQMSLLVTQYINVFE